MSKYFNPRLLNAVIAGTGMRNPVRPHVILGSEDGEFVRGDLMDANAIQEFINQKISDLVNNAPEALDTLKELADAIQENGVADLVTKGQLEAALDDKVDKSDLIEGDANGHEYVDLGLPSGTLWATMNVGASSVTDYGNYYMYGKGATQYNSSDTAYDGTEDPLGLSVDTARQVWGGDWHMPTKTQMQELIANTAYQWVTDYNGSGINGGTFTATNGAVLFIPAAGYWLNGSQYNVGGYGIFWGSSPDNSYYAYYLGFYDGSKDVLDSYREYGYSVRPVINISSKYATKAEVEQLLSNIVQSDWNQSDNTAIDYIKNKPTIPTVPTNVSSFNNDAGYLTSHQDITGKEDKTVIEAASGTTLTAQVGKYYTLSNVGTLAITLPTCTGTNIQSVVFYMSTGSAPAVTFTSTHDVYYADGFEIKLGSTYEVNALWNGTAWIVASVTIIDV